MQFPAMSEGANLRRGPLDANLVFEKNVDLRHIVPEDRHSPQWIAGIAIVLTLVGVTSWLSQRDERILAAERAADRSAALERQLAAFGCAPKGADDGPLVVLVINTSADAHTGAPYRATGCSRVAESAWMWWRLKPGEKPIFADASVK